MPPNPPPSPLYFDFHPALKLQCKNKLFIESSTYSLIVIPGYAEMLLCSKACSGATPTNNQARSNSSTPITVTYRNPQTKHTGSKKQDTASPTNNEGQQFMISDQPITDLRVGLKIIQWRREEAEREELLRSQETATAGPTQEMETNDQDHLAKDSVTPVPSGDELSPSEAGLDPASAIDQLTRGPSSQTASQAEFLKPLRNPPNHEAYQNNQRILRSRQEDPGVGPDLRVMLNIS